MRKFYLPLAIIFCIVASAIWYKFKTELGINDSIISFTGSFFSFYALLIAIMEILSIKSTSKQTQKAVERTEKAFFEYINANEIGKSIELLPFIKNAVTYDDYGRAISNLEKLSTFYCSIFDITQYPDGPQRNTFDIIHATIDRLEIGFKYKTPLSKSETEQILYDMSQIQMEIKIEEKKRNRSKK